MIFPPPSAAPGWNKSCARLSARSPTARSPIITAATSSRKFSTVSRRGKPRQPAHAGRGRRPLRSRDRQRSPGLMPDRRGGLRRPEAEPAGPGRPGRQRQGRRPRGQGRRNWPPCCWTHPGLALTHGELVASLPFADPSLDRLRHELLNLAASGSSLEKPPVLTHFIRQGMAELLTRLGVASGQPAQDPEAVRSMTPKPVFCAPPAICAKWRNGSRNGPGPWSAWAAKASEESWREAQRFLRAPGE